MSSTARRTSAASRRSKTYSKVYKRTSVSKASKKTIRKSRISSRPNLGKSKIGKTVKKIAAVLGLFIISALFVLAVGFYKNLTKNFASADSVNSYSVQTQDIYSVLYISVSDLDQADSPDGILDVHSMSFVIVDKNNKKLVKYDIDPNITIDVPGKFGDEQVTKVLHLGSLNAKDPLEGGVRLASRSVARIFGYPVDKYIITDENVKNTYDRLFNHGVVTLELGKPGGKKTDFTLEEFYSLVSFIRTLPSDRFIFKSFNYDYLQNPDKINTEIRDVTFDSQISLEKKSISVLNGSGLSGVAGYTSRQIENMGGRVVTVGNADKSYDKSILVVDDKESETARKLAHSFDFKQVMTREEFGLQENEVGRSDIVLIIGLDIQDML